MLSSFLLPSITGTHTVMDRRKMTFHMDVDLSVSQPHLPVTWIVTSIAAMVVQDQIKAAKT